MTQATGIKFTYTATFDGKTFPVVHEIEYCSCDSFVDKHNESKKYLADIYPAYVLTLDYMQLIID